MIIFHLTKQDRLNNHIQEEVWWLSRTHSMFIKDGETGELIQVLDLTHLSDEETVTLHVKHPRP